MKRVLGILLSPVILMGIVAGPTALAIDQDEKTSASLGAATACAGHTFDTFSGVSACINEQESCISAGITFRMKNSETIFRDLRVQKMDISPEKNARQLHT